MKNRLLKFIETTNLTMSEFAEKTNISSATLTGIKTDRTKPTLDIVYKIRAAYPELDMQWLVFGEGNMFLSEKNSAQSKTEENIIDKNLFTDLKDMEEANVPNLFSYNENVQKEEKKEPQTKNEGQKSEDKRSRSFDGHDYTVKRQIKKIIVFYTDNTYEEISRV